MNLKQGYLVLLDAAAFASTNPLKLSILGGPDFVSVSFYKLFGYPTGLGALLARRDSLQTLAEGKRYFGGGTVEMHLVDRRWHRPRAAHLEEYFEDGTLPFLQAGQLRQLNCAVIDVVVIIVIVIIINSNSASPHCGCHYRTPPPHHHQQHQRHQEKQQKQQHHPHCLLPPLYQQKVQQQQQQKFQQH